LDTWQGGDTVTLEVHLLSGKTWILFKLEEEAAAGGARGGEGGVLWPGVILGVRADGISVIHSGVEF
jgi:hypothetical protein